MYGTIDGMMATCRGKQSLLPQKHGLQTPPNTAAPSACSTAQFERRHCEAEERANVLQGAAPCPPEDVPNARSIAQRQHREREAEERANALQGAAPRPPEDRQRREREAEARRRAAPSQPNAQSNAQREHCQHENARPPDQQAARPPNARSVEVSSRKTKVAVAMTIVENEIT
ncbi:hypothetical protein B0H12DRAFT_1083092 [Mycena haematopus]|nr:hypothetical protein B0H12DRAFT_1083092 [Mycena haematopus]